MIKNNIKVDKQLFFRFIKTIIRLIYLIFKIFKIKESRLLFHFSEEEGHE